jgi:drug/metabolite transporter (DMT)-like permease
MQTSLIFLALMLSGTFFLGYNDVQRRKYLTQGINEQVLLVAIQIVSGALLLPLLILFGMPVIKEAFWPAFVGTTVLNLISQNLFIRAFKLSEASQIAPLRLLIPPLVVVTGFLFLGEKASLTGIAGILVTVIGLWILLFPNVTISRAGFANVLRDRGVVYGLIGSVLFATSFPLDKETVISSSAVFATSTAAIVVGVLTWLINQLQDRMFTHRLTNAVVNTPGALFFTSLSYAAGIVLTNAAFNYALAAYASSLKRLAALWTVILAGTFLKERVGARLVATAIMFAGILLTAFLR